MLRPGRILELLDVGFPKLIRANPHLYDHTGETTAGCKRDWALGVRHGTLHVSERRAAIGGCAIGHLDSCVVIYR